MFARMLFGSGVGSSCEAISDAYGYILGRVKEKTQLYRAAVDRQYGGRNPIQLYKRFE